MTPEKLMTRRTNVAFLLMTLTLVTQTIATVPSSFFMGMEMAGITLIDPYYTEFVLIQVLYPLCNLLTVLIVLKILRMPLKIVAPVKGLRGDFFPWLGLFLGAATVMNYIMYGAIWLLDLVGITIPDPFMDFYPADLPQAICFFIILTFLPAVCEEFLCRVGITGLLRGFHPWTAVILSAFAFGWMHATLQQIPFAFVIGILMGFIFVKTGNLLYPILFHFINNAWSCTLTFLMIWAPEAVANVISYGMDVVFVLAGIGSLIWLLCKKKLTLKEIPHSMDAKSSWIAAVKSPVLWIFTVLYFGMTLMNLLLPYLMEWMEQLESQLM